MVAEKNAIIECTLEGFDAELYIGRSFLYFYFALLQFVFVKVPKNTVNAVHFCQSFYKLDKMTKSSNHSFFEKKKKDLLLTALL